MEETLEKQKDLKKQLGTLGRLRILTFLLALGIVIWGNYYHNLIGYIVGLLFFIVFLILVKRYNKVIKVLRYYEAKEQVLKFHNARRTEEWKEEKVDEVPLDTLTKLKDLDIIGQASLYQYINTAHTKAGKSALLEALSKGFKDRNTLLKRQEAIKELLKDKDFTLHLETLSILFENNKKMRTKSDKMQHELEDFLSEVSQKKCYVGPIIRLLAMILPFLTCLSLTIALLGYEPKRFIIIVEILFIVQLIISFIYAFKTNHILNLIVSVNEELTAYYDFLAALEGKKFTSSYLKEIQSTLFAKHSALSGLKSLSTLSEWTKVRYNLLGSLLFNGLFMWNIYCLESLESWTKTYSDEVMLWINCIGEIEALVSLSTIGRDKKTYCFPEILLDTRPSLSFKNIKHPLIHENKAIGNDFHASSATTIITGSNMSGKTTFLRSIGVNLILAYAGAPVVADEFSASYMNVLTSMRIEDRTTEGISTFYAELLRIQEMVLYSERHLPMLCLIDEIFKGTNSADRILGARQTIQKLSKPWVNIMVTTHDFELCELETENKRRTTNYHFEEYYEADKIQFDYKIKEGRCQTTNAKYLLRMVGILE